MGTLLPVLIPRHSSAIKGGSPRDTTVSWDSYLKFLSACPVQQCEGTAVQVQGVLLTWFTLTVNKKVEAVTKENTLHLTGVDTNRRIPRV